MEFEGVVYKIMPATKGTSARGDWQRQEVIFDMKGQSQYPRKICVTFFNKAEEVARLTVGAEYNVSIDIERGSYTVIVGHNGSGKSTLAKLLIGLL